MGHLNINVSISPYVKSHLAYLREICKQQSSEKLATASFYYITLFHLAHRYRSTLPLPANALSAQRNEEKWPKRCQYGNRDALVVCLYFGMFIRKYRNLSRCWPSSSLPFANLSNRRRYGKYYWDGNGEGRGGRGGGKEQDLPFVTFKYSWRSNVKLINTFFEYNIFSAQGILCINV